MPFLPALFLASGLSVVMQQLPGNGGVDFSIRGACHSPKPPVFYSTR